jgi:hypothetical protein
MLHVRYARSMPPASPPGLDLFSFLPNDAEPEAGSTDASGELWVPPEGFSVPEDDPLRDEVAYRLSGVGEPEAWEIEEHARTHRMTYRLRRSDFVETAFMVPSSTAHGGLESFTFAERPYLRRIYDMRAKKRLLMAGRQVEKSSTMAFMLLTLCAMYPGYRILYVTPSAMQTKEFSRTKVTEVIETSPVIRAWFPPSMLGNIFERQCINRSVLKMRYAFLTADRCRGLSVDDIFLDEFQDLLMDNIAVIEQASSHSSYGHSLYSGTPKSKDNPMETYYTKKSTMNEWAVPCERHGTPNNPGSWHWNILTDRNVAKKGLVCDRCDQIIRADHPAAHWVRTGSKLGEHGVDLEGFRIPQLMTPWMRDEEKWAKIWSSYLHGNRGTFMNEVCGLSFDNGQRPLQLEDIQRRCYPEWSMMTNPHAMRDRLQRISKGGAIYMGVDWGQDSSNSYTVVVLGTREHGRFRILWADRLTGSEQGRDTQVRLIAETVRLFSVQRVGVDYGGGLDPNAALEREFGTQRIAKIQWCAPPTYMLFDPGKRVWMSHRTEVMSALFREIRHGRMIFPKWSEWQHPFADDMAASIAEYSEKTHLLTFNKSMNATDDTLHAVFFCFLAMMLDTPMPEVFVPSARVDRRLANERDVVSPGAW